MGERTIDLSGSPSMSVGLYNSGTPRRGGAHPDLASTGSVCRHAILIGTRVMVLETEIGCVLKFDRRDPGHSNLTYTDTIRFDLTRFDFQSISRVAVADSFASRPQSAIIID